MADEHERAAVVVVTQVVGERAAHVGEGDLELSRTLPVTGLQRRDGDLPVHRGKDAADLGVAGDLVERDRALLRIDVKGGQRPLLV